MACNKFRAHAVAVYARSLQFERLNSIFVKVAACKNHGVLKARLVQHLARLFAKISQVARIKTYSLGLQALCSHFFENGDCVFHASQRVVGVHKQKAAVGINFRVSPERFKLAVKSHNPAVRVRTRRKGVAHLRRQHVACGAATAD